MLLLQGAIKCLWILAIISQCFQNVILWEQDFWIDLLLEHFQKAFFSELENADSTGMKDQNGKKEYMSA